MRPKRKKCKQCRVLFTPINTLNSVCGFDCAVLLAQTPNGKDGRLKAVKRETRELLQKVKTKAQWAKEAQTAFNKYIRFRDKGLPCISCDKPDNGNHQRHASHYRSVGACSALRFNANNVNTSCATCNSVQSGNLIEYRIRLVKKIGQSNVEWLECQNDITRYDVEYLKDVKSRYTKMARDMKKTWSL